MSLDFSDTVRGENENDDLNRAVENEKTLRSDRKVDRILVSLFVLC